MHGRTDYRHFNRIRCLTQAIGERHAVKDGLRWLLLDSRCCFSCTPDDTALPQRGELYTFSQTQLAHRWLQLYGRTTDQDFYAVAGSATLIGHRQPINSGIERTHAN